MSPQVKVDYVYPRIRTAPWTLSAPKASEVLCRLKSQPPNRDIRDFVKPHASDVENADHGHGVDTQVLVQIRGPIVGEREAQCRLLPTLNSYKVSFGNRQGSETFCNCDRTPASARPYSCAF